MTLIINGTDFSSYIMQEDGIVETPTYIEGPGAGQSQSGDYIFDRIATKIPAQFKLKPMPQANYAAIFSAANQNTVSVTYTSFMQGGDISIYGQLSISSIEYAMQGSTRIYAGATISINPR